MNTEKIVTFEIKKGTVEIEGYADINTIDDDEPDILYRMLPYMINFSWYLPKNPYTEDNSKCLEFEELIKAHAEDELFKDFLCDFQDENKTVDRPGYTLIINPEE